MMKRRGGGTVSSGYKVGHYVNELLTEYFDWWTQYKLVYMVDGHIGTEVLAVVCLYSLCSVRVSKNMLSVAKCMNTRRKLLKADMNTRRKLSKVDTSPGHADKQGEVEMKILNPDLKMTKLREM